MSAKNEDFELFKREVETLTDRQLCGRWISFLNDPESQEPHWGPQKQYYLEAILKERFGRDGALRVITDRLNESWW